MAQPDPTDIDAVIERLDGIIAASLATEDRIGWFAAMYRRVTAAVRQGIVDGRFENGERMVRFDKAFADRFVDAWDSVRAGTEPTEAWKVAFEGAGKRRLVIVQQLLLGMNAHINLDLGIAAATVAPGAEIESLRHDFDEINVVLAELTRGFVDQVDELSPWFARVNRIAGGAETEIIRFNIDIARAEAWRLATRLAGADPAGRDREIGARDRFTADLGRLITRPGVVLPLLLLVARLREPNDVNRVTRFLMETPVGR